MTTTLIYEPMASISDDYFQPPKAGGSASSRDTAADRSAVETRKLALNVSDGHVARWTAMRSRSNEKVAK